uniref:Uncharacterized protein n=1 Tax=Solanum tuberosum TaxID=4113 RepID=M1AY27_SOLTU
MVRKTSSNGSNSTADSTFSKCPFEQLELVFRSLAKATGFTLMQDESICWFRATMLLASDGMQLQRR